MAPACEILPRHHGEQRPHGAGETGEQKRTQQDRRATAAEWRT